MTLSLISIGLSDEKDLSLRALEEARDCDKLYAELYTMKLATTIAALTELTLRPVQYLRRDDLEDRADVIIEEARGSHIGVLVGGDCLSATTHISLIIEAVKRGIKVSIIHGSSIFSSVAESGLSIYKFGRTVTLPFEEKGSVDTILKVIKENLEQGLHTLVLLDLDNEADKYMTINHALRRLFESGFSQDNLVVGIARLGSQGSVIKAGRAKDIVEHDFGESPHSLIIPGSLHFLEVEALEIIGDCPLEALQGRSVKSEIDTLIEKYIQGCRRVRADMKIKATSITLTEKQIQSILDHVDKYLSDAEYYSTERKPTSLTSVSYAEGILDALKILGISEFEW